MSHAVPSVLDAKQRAWKHWTADGLHAIVSGIATTTIGVGLFWNYAPFHFRYGEDGSALLIFAALTFFSFQIQITEWLKARFTYPRTGYVASPHEPAFRGPKPMPNQTVDGKLTSSPARSVKRIIEWLKAYLSYLRAEHVTSPEDPRPKINEKIFPQPEPTLDQTVDNMLTVVVFLLILGLAFSQRWMIVLFALLHIYLSWRFRKRVYIPWHKKYLPPIVGLLLTIVPVDLKITGPVLLIIVGLLSIFSGMRNVVHYFMKHPVPSA